MMVVGIETKKKFFTEEVCVYRQADDIHYNTMKPI